MGGPGPNQQGAPPLQAQYGQGNMQRPPNQQQPNMRPPNMQQQGNNIQQQGQQGPYGQQQYPPRQNQLPPQQSGQHNPADHPGWSQ